jgi:hypothetical protein
MDSGVRWAGSRRFPPCRPFIRFRLVEQSARATFRLTGFEHRSGFPGNVGCHCVLPLFCLFFYSLHFILEAVTAETFKLEIAEAMKAYEKYVICIDKVPEEFHTSLTSLLNKAIKAYESRGPHLRHGIALDRQVTVILSQNDTPRPLCGIYFNLHSPYQKASLAKAAKPVREPISGSPEE